MVKKTVNTNEVNEGAKLPKRQPRLSKKQPKRPVQLQKKLPKRQPKL